MKTKSAGLAAVLSFFIPGLGQIYNGEFVKAFVFLLAAVIGGLLCASVIGFLIAALVWIWAIVDAYYAAEMFNEAHRSRGHHERYRRNAPTAA